MSMFSGEAAPAAPAAPQEFKPVLFNEVEGGGTQFLGGRFDVEGHAPVTPADIENNPAMGRLATSYAHAEHKISEITNGKVIVKEALPDDFFTQEFEFTDEGQFAKGPRKTMLDAGIPEAALMMFETLSTQHRAAMKKDQDAWTASVTERCEGKFDEFQSWVKQNFSEAERVQFDKLQADVMTRDMCLNHLITQWGKAGKPAGNPMQIGDPGAPNNDNTVYSGTIEEATKAYRAEYAMAEDPNALDAKWARTQRRFAG